MPVRLSAMYGRELFLGATRMKWQLQIGSLYTKSTTYGLNKLKDIGQ